MIEEKKETDIKIIDVRKYSSLEKILDLTLMVRIISNIQDIVLVSVISHLLLTI